MKAGRRCKGDESHLDHCLHTTRSCGIAEVAGVTCIKNEGAYWAVFAFIFIKQSLMKRNKLLTYQQTGI